MRDMRIAMIYEGTTGIQSLDLLGRKVMGTGGELLRNFTKQVHKFCKARQDNEALAPFIAPLQKANGQWGELTMQIGAKAMENPDEVGAASVDFTMFSGYVVLAYMWAQMIDIAQARLAEGTSDKAFYEAKIATGRFYFERILPRIEGHAAAACAGADSVMALDDEAFAF